MAESDPLAVPDGVADETLRDLYARPLEEFTAARDALAKQLRADGQADAAAWAKGLRKPSVAAWTVNQIAGREGSRVAELRDVAADLARLQEELVKGEADREQLQAAQQRERQLVAELVAAAEDVSPAAGAATVDKVRETLHAAALDKRVRDLIALGRLPREQVAVGLGPMVASAPSGAKAPSAGKSKRTSALERKLERAERAERGAREKLEVATEAAADARRDLERAERQARRAAAAAEKAAGSHQAAEARVADLRAERADAPGRKR